MKRQVVAFLGQRQVQIVDEMLPPLEPDDVLVATVVSGICAGTELMVYRGDAPIGLSIDETIAALAGDFSYPLSYGYANVGRVVARGPSVGPEWHNRLVFAFQPHATHFVAPVANVVPIDFEPRLAVLLPSMETAVNLVLDGRPLVGERVVVVGQGVVGLLTTALLNRFPLNDLVVVEPLPSRQEWARCFGAREAGGPPDVGGGWLNERLGDERADLVYELSGNPAALNLAIEATGYAGRVVIGSWYGQASSSLSLGGRFHRSKMSLVASQVSHLAPGLTGRWSKGRRLTTAVAHLRTLQPDRLITHEIAFAEVATAFQLLDERPDEALQVVLRYNDAE